MPLADASSISAIAPLIVTALSVFVLGEKVGLRRWAAVLVGFAGVLIIIRPGPNVINPWAFLPIINAFCFAAYTLTTRSLNSTDAPATSLFYGAFTGAVLISAVAPFTWQPMEPLDWFKMVLLGLTGGLSHLLLIRAYEHAQASVLSPFSYTQIVWTSFLGYVAFGDLPDRWTVVGATIVSAAGIYVFYRETVRRRAAA
jgi:drug/metabolite transporter (DMT)-like permease